MSHWHRHYFIDFNMKRMLGQKCFYTGTGNIINIKFDINVDWLMILGDNGTKYGMYDSENNQCLLSGNFNSNPSQDNSIQSSDNVNFVFSASPWSVLNDEYCIIAFGKSPRTTEQENKYDYAFHKHPEGFDGEYKTQMCIEHWTGNGDLYNIYIDFNYGFAIVYDLTDNLVYYSFNEGAYSTWGIKGCHKQGFNAVNPEYIVNAFKTYLANTSRLRFEHQTNILDHEYVGYFSGVYHHFLDVFKGGHYPGHRHKGGWDNFNRVVGYVSNYVGDADMWLAETYMNKLKPDVMIFFRQSGDNNDIIYVWVDGYSVHDHSMGTCHRLTKAGVSVDLVDWALRPGDTYMYLHENHLNVNTVNYSYIYLKIINPKTVV